MKTLANRILILAASAMVLGTMAYGQTELKAQIPFAFRTSNDTHPAGEYTVRDVAHSGRPLITLRNTTLRRMTFVSGGVSDRWNAGSAALLFRCDGDAPCMLAGIRTPEGMTAYYSGRRKHARGKDAAVFTVPLRALNAD